MDNPSSLSGLTREEAKEFHEAYVRSTMIFVGVAAVAHILVWAWRPWFPGVEGYSSLIDGAQQALTMLG